MIYFFIFNLHNRETSDCKPNKIKNLNQFHISTDIFITRYFIECAPSPIENDSKKIDCTDSSQQFTISAMLFAFLIAQHIYCYQSAVFFIPGHSNKLLFVLKIDIFVTGEILQARKYQAISCVKRQPDNFILALGLPMTYVACSCLFTSLAFRLLSVSYFAVYRVCQLSKHTELSLSIIMSFSI